MQELQGKNYNHIIIKEKMNPKKLNAPAMNVLVPTQEEEPSSLYL